MADDPTVPAAADPGPPKFWRSLEEREIYEGPARTDEFLPGAPEWPADVSRRDFLRLAAASMSLVGVAGCSRRGPDVLVPYVIPPEHAVLEDALFYTTAMAWEGYARGILVETHFGRPTKLEGNPQHPENRGATDVWTQAAILSLYDPDRSRAPRQRGRASSWETFAEEWLARRTASPAAASGRGVAIVTEPTTSPTLLREIYQILGAWPEARWYQYTPLARYDDAGAALDYDWAAADVVLTIASDCLHRHPAAQRYGRGYAERRRVENGQVNLSRFYSIESTPTVTGTLADFRLPASPERTRVLLDQVSALLGSGEPAAAAKLSPSEDEWVRGLAQDLKTAGPAALCIAGEETDPEVRAWALAVNRQLGAIGHTVHFVAPGRSDADARAAGSLAELTAAIDRGEVTSLFLVGVNPIYTSPGAPALAEKLRRVEFSVHAGGYIDETARLCTWHLPESHFLEAWGDLRSYGDGTVTVQQPVIEPLYETHSLPEILRSLRVGAPPDGYDIVRETWVGATPDVAADAGWQRALSVGVVPNSALAPVAAPASAAAGIPRLAPEGAGRPSAPVLLIAPDSSVLDGRFANNAWLQELPRPITRLVWDNAVLIGPAHARRLGVSNGDVLELQAGAIRIYIPAWIVPGQADECLTVTLGYGRTAGGEVARGCGVDIYPMRSTATPWRVENLQVRKTARTHALVATQGHFAMEGRDLVRVLAPRELANAEPRAQPQPSLYKNWPAGQYAWGMLIDLSTCLGCNACVIACQAENNIPSVGRDQVARGREMQWLRVDRYFEGDPENPRTVVEPVPCMHCENAPCELVCPVGATVHSSEGLNQMVYNRCVGTRYCSNNCPYKVRRFNFLIYRPAKDSELNLQKNPNVSVRERGVMEKCTYCVQRIESGRKRADKENRAIRDGEVQTACQQACPADAIIFGNIGDPGSRVSRRKRERSSFSLLDELNTRPRTTYLAKMRHESPRAAEPAARPPV